MNKQSKVLVIGCGRAGAGIGDRQHRNRSHAGVLSTISSFDTTLYDPNIRQANTAARILGLSAIEKLSDRFLSGCECVVICSPTNTHFLYLKRFMESGIPLIVCEKPICDSLSDVKALRKLKEKCNSRVIVNYTRRFQPSFQKLKKRFSSILTAEPLRAISIRYQRGFLNNASHAFDLIEFFTGWDVLTATVRTCEGVCDEFQKDPTISCYGHWNGAAFSVVGLSNVRFSLFEIDFFFERSAIRLRDRGETIEFSNADEPSDYYAPLVTNKVIRTNRKEPLKHLYCHVRRMILNPESPDNFLESLNLTEWFCRTLKKAL